MAMLNARILRYKEVLNRLGIGKSTLYDWLNPKSPRYDPSFPKQVNLSPHSVGWIEAEINLWIEQRRLISIR